MSQQEWEKFLKFEKEKHDNFFIPYYKKKGYKIIEDWVGKNSPYDVKIEKDGRLIKIEEKARSQIYDDLLVEVMQDLESGKLGWFYNTTADLLLYGMWGNKIEPEMMYVVNMQKLRKLVMNEFLKFEDKISVKGYGITFNKIINWSDLLWNKIATKEL